MWIVQELLLAKHIQFLVSGVSFVFYHFAELVEDRKSQHAKKVQRVLAHVNARSPDTDQSRSLYDLLTDFSACQCQDPRDNVFALLSLVHREERTILEQFFPDYSLTHEAVVVITISHLRDYSGKQLTLHGRDIFDSVGAV